MKEKTKDILTYTAIGVTAVGTVSSLIIMYLNLRRVKKMARIERQLAKVAKGK